jgi:hypothetical protein
MDFVSKSNGQAYTKYKSIEVTSTATASGYDLENSKIISQDVANSIAQNQANIIDQTIQILNTPLNFREIDSLLTNSCYIVPPNTFLAYYIKINLTTQEIQKIPIKDQTIWIINSCNNGYIIGLAYSIVISENTNEIISSKFNYFFGSISESGFIDFYFTSGNGILNDRGLLTTLGLLKYNTESSKYLFDMQLSYPFYSSINTKVGPIIGFMHSSYMVDQNINEKLPQGYCFNYVNEFIDYVMKN